MLASLRASIIGGSFGWVKVGLTAAALSLPAWILTPASICEDPRHSARTISRKARLAKHSIEALEGERISVHCSAYVHCPRLQDKCYQHRYRHSLLELPHLSVVIHPTLSPSSNTLPAQRLLPSLLLPHNWALLSCSMSSLPDPSLMRLLPSPCAYARRCQRS